MRTKRFAIRLSEEEMERYREAAGGRRLSWWVRKTLDEAVRTNVSRGTDVPTKEERP